MLSKYQPAIAGFPWQVGDERFEAMKELKELYELEEVAPLTGFDNGMVVYHRSVLPLFFVSSPLPDPLLYDRLSLFVVDRFERPSKAFRSTRGRWLYRQVDTRSPFPTGVPRRGTSALHSLY